MSKATKLTLLILGGLSGVLIVSQFLLGRMIAAGHVQYLKPHQHTGYLTVAVVLVYVLASTVAIARTPRPANEVTPRP